MNTERKIRPVAIIGGARIPFCKAGTSYSDLRLIDLMVGALHGLVAKYNLKGISLDEVALGTVFDHPSVWNLSREAVMASGLSLNTPAVGVQRACATSLDSAIHVANKIALGQIDVGIAGGAESMSDPAIFFGYKFSHRLLKLRQAKSWAEQLKCWKQFTFSELKPHTAPPVERTTGRSMGQHCEMMVKDWKVSRQEQDEIAFRSHQNAAKAYAQGFYKDLVSTFHGVSQDNTVRADTAMEKLAQLKPAFDRSESGTITAGNSSPLTDGAATVLLASEDWARAHGYPVLAYLTEYQTAAVDIHQEGLLMAPAYAMPKMLSRRGLALQDFDFYEIHEAFAGQVACTLKAWRDEKFCREKLGLQKSLGGFDLSKMNTVGGSVALGHPFGATGARILSTLAHLLAHKGGKGVISICTGGGMGTVSILEK